MFSMIIAVISVILIIVITVATIFFGGSTFTKGGADAKAAQILTQSQQIEAAISLYTNDHAGNAPATLDDLVTKEYLKSIPKGLSTVKTGTPWTLESAGFNNSLGTTEESTCLSINKKLGLADEFNNKVPLCTDAAVAGKMQVCCEQV